MLETGSTCFHQIFEIYKVKSVWNYMYYNLFVVSMNDKQICRAGKELFRVAIRPLLPASFLYANRVW